MPIPDPAKQAGIVRVKLDPILMPHRELPFRRVRVGASSGEISGSHLVVIESIQFSLKLSRSEPSNVTLKITVNVIRVILPFNK